jgi:outer membrane protein assembly factor BamB
VALVSGGGRDGGAIDGMADVRPRRGGRALLAAEAGQYGERREAVAFDPTLGHIFVNVSNLGGTGRMEKAPEGAPVPYRPVGEMIAVNANTGDIAWRSPLGSYPEHPNAGTPNLGGPIATAGGLVFIGAARLEVPRLRFEDRQGTVDRRDRWLGPDGPEYVSGERREAVRSDRRRRSRALPEHRRDEVGERRHADRVHAAVVGMMRER